MFINKQPIFHIVSFWEILCIVKFQDLKFLIQNQRAEEKYRRQYLPHHFVSEGERREAAIFIFAMQPPSPTAVIDNNLQEEITEY